jgi:hypothetical protein
MEKLRDRKYYWKDNGIEKNLYVEIEIKSLAQIVDVCIYHITEKEDISDFAIKSLEHIERIDLDEIEKMKDRFWFFAQNCMEGGNFGADPNIIKGGKEQLEWSMNYLKIFDKEEAFRRTKVKFADTSNDGYGGFVNGVGSSFKLWFETPWDDHMTVVICRNGVVYDIECA